MSKPIRTLLIANRGEIAVRIIRTCREMGIATVTVYSDADASLPHASLSDASYPLGDGTLADTYLNIDILIAIAKQAGADAVHPGYGFLSENATFAKAVKKAGLIFVGPSAEAIELMGDKIAAREAAEKAGLPLIPGYNGERQYADTLADEADKMGYPVMIKASAGGGGKGMRVVEQAADFNAALEEAKSEAQHAFGDDRIFLERFITSPRHIEVQVFSDSHGNHLHFFERECSIQRRHQKIIEESPSPALDDTLRQNITRTAVNIAKDIGYLGAGTVEFILDVDNSFYFLEMNTRLQVEHPVTEMVTGEDLVKLQILVAQGNALPMTQDEIVQHGHAIECRLYAEDPGKGFLPATGMLEYIGTPSAQHVRLDSGFAAGNEVTTRYDPMLAKLIAWAPTRKDAAETCCTSLNEVLFAGVKTNRAYLQRILQHAAFLSGDTYTHFVETHKDELLATELTDKQIAALIAAYLLQHRTRGAIASHAEDHAPPSAWASHTLAGFRNS